MAERTVDLAFRQLEVVESRQFALSRSSSRKLSGGLYHSFKAFVADIGETELTELPGPPLEEMELIIANYSDQEYAHLRAWEARVYKRL